MSSTVAPGSMVLVTHSIGTDKQEYVYAHVLTVAPSVEGLTGEKGEPTISVAYMESHPNLATLGSSNWQAAFKREANVAHASHAEVVAGTRGICWCEVLPDASGYKGWPQLPVSGGTSHVYSREAADAFFSQDAKVVPGKLEPVVGGKTVDHTKDDGLSSVVTTPPQTEKKEG